MSQKVCVLQSVLPTLVSHWLVLEKVRREYFDTSQNCCWCGLHMWIINSYHWCLLNKILIILLQPYCC